MTSAHDRETNTVACLKCAAAPTPIGPATGRTKALLLANPSTEPEMERAPPKEEPDVIVGTASA